ncbi:S-layer homology domain-containing protein [Candidatus Peribacteria bacterium]|nr:S-layer homology domain-containing protein [Candidatus Peribacteria bacterium]
MCSRVTCGHYLFRSLMKNLRFATVLVSLILVQPFTALGAGLFSDVSDSYTFKGEIESLARLGILKGNPDGNFYPDRSVNRAEFLKMLYVATNRKPKAIYVHCFSDVEAGSWYEGYVCDAASKEYGFVKGYSDSLFRPASPVTRTEALKMVFMLFNILAPDISQNDQSLIKFVDISTSAWYSRYISAAYMNGLLPLANQSGSRFNPDLPLTRGEAAAYIFNAQKTLEKQQSSQQAVFQSSIPSSESSSSSSVRTDIIKTLSIPFVDSDTFIEKRPAVYLFTLTKQSDIGLQVSTAGYYHSDVTCRLYLLKDDGFTSEYYLGFQENSMCTIKATLRPGKYQLQLQPSVGNTLYSVSAKAVFSDGNDGFSTAVELRPGLVRTSILESGDIVDWYSFKVMKEGVATVEITAGEVLSCVIYTPQDVDQFGFKGPECNVPYIFKPSANDDAYMVGIGRKSGDQIHRVPYTVQFH